MPVPARRGKRTAVWGRQRIYLEIYFGVYLGFARLSVYLLLTVLNTCALDVGASKYDIGVQQMEIQIITNADGSWSHGEIVETGERTELVYRSDARKMTKRVYSAMDDGLLSADAVALMCLRYMSEADVAEMLRINEISDI